MAEDRTRRAGWPLAVVAAAAAAAPSSRRRLTQPSLGLHRDAPPLNFPHFSILSFLLLPYFLHPVFFLVPDPSIGGVARPPTSL